MADCRKLIAIFLQAYWKYIGYLLFQTPLSVIIDIINVLIVSCYWSLIKSKIRPLGFAALYPYVSILGFSEWAS